jgi:hypothetical protein
MATRSDVANYATYTKDKVDCSIRQNSTSASQPTATCGGGTVTRSVPRSGSSRRTQTNRKREPTAAQISKGVWETTLRKSETFMTAIHDLATAIRDRSKGIGKWPKGRLVSYYVYVVALKDFVGKSIPQPAITHLLAEATEDIVGHPLAEVERNQLLAHMASHISKFMGVAINNGAVLWPKDGRDRQIQLKDLEKIKASHKQVYGEPGPNLHLDDKNTPTLKK